MLEIVVLFHLVFFFFNFVDTRNLISYFFLPALPFLSSLLPPFFFFLLESSEPQICGLLCIKAYVIRVCIFPGFIFTPFVILESQLLSFLEEGRYKHPNW